MNQINTFEELSREFAATWFDGKYYSSAKEIEEDVKSSGFKMPVKLYYEYKLPDGMKANVFESKCREFFLVLRRESKVPKNLRNSISQNLNNELDQKIPEYNNRLKDVYKRQTLG